MKDKLKQIISQFKSLNVQRLELLAKAPEGPLKQFLSVPFPDNKTEIADLDILAVDFETTGLNAKSDKLLSVGYVPIEHGLIKLGKSEHEIIHSSGDLHKDNVVIHQITDNEKANGLALELVVEKMLNALAGKVMLVHYATIERTFLQQACIELYGMAPIWPIIDTLALAKKRLDRSDTAYDPNQLRLINLRHSYGLPAHHEHNALNDAVATGELFLAQMRHYPLGFNTLLKEFVSK
ncbi:exonuclease domain-containing protein [Thalassotalea psychrophila]|uniref:Exonuclease domain-containing protein n=1 Tax=Thalassotalea psychrophila TaxID=3065647 RepID=A0ABY9TV00_9GAMM|nr:exonuclease domain-containing protein [Colwelliaceae bacterium SQ149]